MSKSLTKPMRDALRSLVEGNEPSTNSSTLSALQKRGYVDASSMLTEDGTEAALASLPLKRQCDLMSLDYSEIESVKTSKRPEVIALKYFTKNGYRGISGEGTPILLLIKAAILDFVTKHSDFESREGCCRRYTEAHLQIHIEKSSELLKIISKVKRRTIKANLKEIIKVHEAPGPTEGLTVKSLLELYGLIGSRGLEAIAKLILDDPYKYRKGWPDLIVWRKGSIRWVEIKTTDKLHKSQICTFRKLRSALPGSLEVAKVNTIERISWYRRLTSR